MLGAKYDRIGALPGKGMTGLLTCRKVGDNFADMSAIHMKRLKKIKAQAWPPHKRHSFSMNIANCMTCKAARFE